ncbi:caspase family protein [Variovorax sp. YR752]|uniref:caspase family protein n=1 Tax=Variovorax sp. YR752 TaxID=1884383 RepID=UPI003137764A
MTARSLVRHAAAALLLGAALSAPAAGKVLAVLVGVSEYPTLDKRYQLEGPRNDVKRLRAVLQQRGVAAQDLRVLADGVDGAELPTRAAILGAWQQAAERARAGDVLVLYFAGHGSQQPADRRTPQGREEVDGLNEIILPRDVGPWANEKVAVANAIVDHELRRIVDAVTAKGAFVWAIFDACHSATLVRSAADTSSEVRYRQVAPGDLGIPARALDEAATRSSAPAAPAAPVAAATGGSAFFYAVQTDQAAPEMRLPLGEPGRTSHGLFSFTLARALESGRPMSYRQLAQQVFSDYAAMNEARVTPLFSGSALDRAVLDQPAPPVRQWALQRDDGLSLRAGRLSDIAVGTVFAVVPRPLAAASEAIGFVRAESVDSARTTLAPLAWAGKPAPDPAAMPPGAHARLVQSGVAYRLRVAVDAAACAARDCPARAALDRLRAAGTAATGVEVEWLAPGAAADVTLRVLPDRVQVLAPSQQLRTDCARDGKRDDKRDCAAPPTLGLRIAPAAPAETVEAELAALLHRLGRATNLMRLAAAQPASGFGSAGLELSLWLLKPGGAQPLGAERVPRLRAGDVLELRLRNPGRIAVDATVLYTDANYGITALWPDASGVDNRLGPGDEHALRIDITDEAIGVERILTIAAEAQAKAERTDLSFLAQPPLTVLRSASPATADELIQGFRDAAFAEHTTRGAAVRRPTPRTAMHVLTLQVVR